ncbi:MAG: N-acetyltransferase family protein [Alphaproteobacteria bacterium]
MAEQEIKPRIDVELVSTLNRRELDELCEAAGAAIVDGAGFGWVRPPERDAFERYWRGVLIVPERKLFLARLDQMVAGSVQLVNPPRQKEAWAHACLVDTHFVAPWARGHGLARALVEAALNEARACGFEVMNLSVRETQGAAIALYEGMGFVRWGTHPKYAKVEGKLVAGLYYWKDL